MTGNAILERPRRAIRARPAEEAALRRVSALMRAEAAELDATGWLARHLEVTVEDLRIWGPRVLPELRALTSPNGARDADPWAAGPDPCPLAPAEAAALRRIGTWMRAEAAELGGSPLARRLDGWGVRLALECEGLAAA
jgi:hypothetical protein